MALAIILALGMIPFMVLSASAAQEGDYTYEVVGGEAIITNYSSTAPGGNITIPSQLGDYPVTKIDDDAFGSRDKLERITIPDTVISIGARAFRGCTRLASISIPDSVVSIGEEAFYDCSFKSVTIPKSVETIGAHAIGFKGGYSVYTKISNFKLYCYKNTAGQTYASNNGFAFELIDGTPFENFFRAIANFFRSIINALWPF